MEVEMEGGEGCGFGFRSAAIFVFSIPFCQQVSRRVFNISNMYH